MPEQLFIAVCLLCFLFLFEFLLSLLPANPFKRLKIVGNILSFQRGPISKQTKIQRSSVHHARILPGSLLLILDGRHENRILQLSFATKHTAALYRYLCKNLPQTSIEYSQEHIGHHSII